MNPIQRFQRAVTLLIDLYHRRQVAKLALLKSPKVRSPKDSISISQLLQRHPFCWDFMQREGQALFEQFCDHVHLTIRQPGNTVIQKGDAGQHFYMLLKGTANIVLYTPCSVLAGRLMQEVGKAPPYNDTNMYTSFVLKELKQGEHFGDMALIDNSPISATIICKTQCELAYVGKHQFLRFFMGKSQTIMTRLNLLNKLPFLQGWDDGQLRSLSYELKPKTFYQGNTIYSQGQSVQMLYLVHEGHVELSVSKGGRTFHLCRIDCGQLFGYDGITYNSDARCGSVRCELFMIDKTALNRFLEWRPDAKNVLKSTTESRKRWRDQRLVELEHWVPPQITPKPVNNDFNTVQKFTQLVSPHVRRLSSNMGTMDLEQKKIAHKEILNKLNKVNSGKQLEMFKVTNNFKELRRKEMASQAKFMQGLRQYLGKDEPVEFDFRSIRITSHGSAFNSMPSSPTKQLISPKRNKRQLSIQGFALMR